MIRTYLIMPDGSICWEPSAEDMECFREEMRDLACDSDEWD